MCHNTSYVKWRVFIHFKRVKIHKVKHLIYPTLDKQNFYNGAAFEMKHQLSSKVQICTFSIQKTFGNTAETVTPNSNEKLEINRAALYGR